MNPTNDPAAEPMIARDATYHRAPDALRESLRASLSEAARADRGPRLARTLGFAAAFATVAVVSWNVALMTVQPSMDELRSREIVTAHVRSLMGAGHLNDVASSDQHTVKPWFSGKLDFAPPVHDLADAGFALTGGRLDYIHAPAGAALTYRSRQHGVNSFVWPPPHAPAVEPGAVSPPGR